MKGYRIIRELGAGGFGHIYLAQREGSGSLSVIKKLREDLTHEEVARARFLREAEVGILLEHENIARLEDAWFENRVLCIACELVPGHDLEAIVGRLAPDPLPPELAVSVVVRLLAGLHYAHELCDPEGLRLELVHRDVAPKNVMIGYGGQVKLIDFGIARASVGDFRTKAGVIIGTPRYLSPEQASGEPVDRRSDIYSAGVVLFELLAGRPLITASDLHAIMRAILLDNPPPVMRSLDPVIARALAKDRRARYPTALAFRDAIVAAAPELARIDGAEIGRFVSSHFAAEKAHMEETLEHARKDEPIADLTRMAPPRPPRSKRSWLPFALSAAVLALTGAIAVRRTQPPRVPPRSPEPESIPMVRVHPAPQASARPPVDPPPPPKRIVAKPAKPPEPIVKAREPTPKPAPPPARRGDPSIRALREDLAALRSGRAEPKGIFDLSERIKREAWSILDDARRSELLAKVSSSVTLGDLNGLSAAIDEIERSRAR